MKDAPLSHGATGLAHVRRATEYATEMHEGQKYGRRPYIEHCQAVAAVVAHLGWKFSVVALLHDVVEDTAATRKDIEIMYGPIIGDAVGAITRRDGENYFKEYIPRVSVNVIAREVKKADAAINFAAKGKPKLKARYERVLAELSD